MFKIEYAKAHYSEVELQGLQWLAQRAKYIAVVVKRRSDREFDLDIEGTYDGDDGYEYGPSTPLPSKGPGKLFRVNRTWRGYPQVRPHRFSAWFPLAALSEFRSFGLHRPLHDDWSFTRDMEARAIWAEFDRCVQLARSRPVVSLEIEQAVRTTWQELYEEGIGVKNNSEAIELCLDADRLGMAGAAGVAADAEVDWLVERFGYEKVARQIAHQVKLV